MFDTVVVVVNTEHPPDAFIVYVIVYMPAVAFAGLMVPFDGFIGKPEGDMEKLPDLSPVIVTGTAAAVDELHRLAGV